MSPLQGSLVSKHSTCVILCSNPVVMQHMNTWKAQEITSERKKSGKPISFPSLFDDGTLSFSAHM